MRWSVYFDHLGLAGGRSQYDLYNQEIIKVPLHSLYGLHRSQVRPHIRDCLECLHYDFQGLDGDLVC